jgi:hypothetical protein
MDVNWRPFAFAPHFHFKCLHIQKMLQGLQSDLNNF